MPALQKFNTFALESWKGTHDLDGTHTLKVMLTNVAPVATNSQKSDLTEIAAGNGYTAGGQTTTPTLSQTSGVAKLVLSDVVFTAAGGTMATFRYAVVYNDTAANDELIGWYDHGVAVSLLDTRTFTVDFDGTNGAMTLQ